MCIWLRNFMGAPAPGAPMLPTPLLLFACVNLSTWLLATCPVGSMHMSAGAIANLQPHSNSGMYNYFHLHIHDMATSPTPHLACKPLILES